MIFIKLFLSNIYQVDVSYVFIYGYVAKRWFNVKMLLITSFIFNFILCRYYAIFKFVIKGAEMWQWNCVIVWFE